MNDSKLWYLLAYDVRDDKRLRRVARLLEGYGVRLQYSLFRCRLSERQLERLRWELSRVMDAEDDLLIVGLCKSCGSRIRKNNETIEWVDRQPTFEIV